MAEKENTFFEEEVDLIKHLRQEARDVKQCFTTYSYQALIFSSAVLGVAFSTLQHYRYAVFSVVPVIVFLMIICRTGIFKYSTANRIYGYELHLERIKTMYRFGKDDSTDKVLDLYKFIGWEEAQRAWRIIQTAIFRRIYKTPDEDKIAFFLKKNHVNFINYFRPDLYALKAETKELLDIFKSCVGSTGQEFQCGFDTCLFKGPCGKGDECKEYPWFMVDYLSENGIKNVMTREEGENGCPGSGLGTQSTYHAGSYLKNILGVLILAQWLLLTPLVIDFCMSLGGKDHSPPRWLTLFVLIVTSILIFLRQTRITRRRRILENELLSIHSCAIVWQAVVIAHYSALKRTNGTFHHYTQYLSLEAKCLRECTYVIHDWIAMRTRELVEWLPPKKNGQSNKMRGFLNGLF